MRSENRMLDTEENDYLMLDSGFLRFEIWNLDCNPELGTCNPEPETQLQ